MKDLSPSTWLSRFPPSFPLRPTSARTSERSREVQNPAPRSAADGSPSLEETVQIAHEARHSDVHLGVGEAPRYRARGDMQCTEWPVTRAEVFQGWLQEILTPQQIDGFNRYEEFHGSHAFSFLRVRINLMD